MSKIQNFPDIADSQGHRKGPGLEEKELVALCAHPWGCEVGLPGSKPETAVAPVHPRMRRRQAEGLTAQQLGHRCHRLGSRVCWQGRGAPTVALQSRIFAVRRSLRTSLF